MLAAELGRSGAGYLRRRIKQAWHSRSGRLRTQGTYPLPRRFEFTISFLSARAVPASVHESMVTESESPPTDWTSETSDLNSAEEREWRAELKARGGSEEFLDDIKARDRARAAARAEASAAYWAAGAASGPAACVDAEVPLQQPSSAAAPESPASRACDASPMTPAREARFTAAASPTSSSGSSPASHSDLSLSPSPDDASGSALKQDRFLDRDLRRLALDVKAALRARFGGRDARAVGDKVWLILTLCPAH
jgi:hypothetical protein